MPAVRSLGKDKFVVEKLDFADSRPKAIELENFYIEKFNALHPNGYNSILKKDGKDIRAQAFREKVKRKLQGRKNKICQSKYSGVQFHRYGFCSRFILNKKQHYLGIYKTETDAAIARDLYALENDADPKLNFPNLIEEYEHCGFEEFQKGRALMRSETSKVRGVSFTKNYGKWNARAYPKNQKYINLGYFETEKEAIQAVKNFQPTLIPSPEQA